MTTTINGSSPSITFSDSTTQTTAFTGSASTLTSGTLPAARLPAGSVLQVINAIKTDTASFTSSTFTDVSGLSITITPTNSSSKFLIIAHVNAGWVLNVTKTGGRLMRDSTPIAIADAAGNRTRATGVIYTQADSFNSLVMSTTFLDSPSTASAITYKWQCNATDNAGTTYVNRGSTDGDTSNNARTVSTITVMEIAG
jgi:hypothetical protein